MGKARDKLLTKAKSGATLTFRELVKLAKAAGYDQLPSKKATSHKRFRNQACPDANDMNFQEKGKDAKPYQVRQLVGEIEFYDLFRRVDEQNEQ